MKNIGEIPCGSDSGGFIEGAHTGSEDSGISDEANSKCTLATRGGFCRVCEVISNIDAHSLAVARAVGKRPVTHCTIERSPGEMDVRAADGSRRRSPREKSFLKSTDHMLWSFRDIILRGW